MRNRYFDALFTQLKGTLARNALWMSLGQVLRFAIQAAYFTVIARSLGVKNYGAFAGVVALVGILYPFAAIGRGNLLIKNVARDRSCFRRMWGKALATTCTFGSMMVLLIVLVSHYVLPVEIPRRLVLLVALSDVVGLNLITIAGQSFQAFEQLGWTALINICISGFRLVGALILYMVQHHPSALQWGYSYLASTLCITVCALCMVSTKLGKPIPSLPESWSEFREGIYFSVGLSAQTIYNDIDKAMLARLSTLSATGVYGAAYRVIDVSFSPVSALLYAAYPRLFSKGMHGVASSVPYAMRIMWKAVGYAAFIGCVLILGSNVVPLVLGPQYHDTAEALRWLAPLLVLKAIHYFLSDALSGAGHQGIRSMIQVGVALFNVGINLWIIPRYSWRGAAWSSIASDALLVCSIAICVQWLVRQENARRSLPSAVAD